MKNSEKEFKKNVLIVVDAQNDFIDGKLGSKEAENAVPNIVKLVNKFVMNNERVIFTQDTHHNDYLDTYEGEKLPVEHCLEGSEGWQISQKIMDAYYDSMCDYETKRQKKYEFSISSIKNFYNKNTFGSLDLIEDLKHTTIRTGYETTWCSDTTFVLCGFCTDICVISNACLLRAAFPNNTIKIISNACAGVTPESHEAALKVANSCQIDVEEI